MTKNNSLYTEVDISRLYKNGQEIKHKDIVVSESNKNTYIQVENISGKIIEIRFSTETPAMFYFVKIGEIRQIPETCDSKNHKLYIRVLEKE